MYTPRNMGSSSQMKYCLTLIRVSHLYILSFTLLAEKRELCLTAHSRSGDSHQSPSSIPISLPLSEIPGLMGLTNIFILFFIFLTVIRPILN